MAERNPPAWLQAGSHPADLDRRILESVFRTDGVLDLAGGDLAVTEQGTPAMGVTVAAGVAVIDGTESASQGVYHVVNDADVDLAIAASDPTNDRIDLVVAQVRDSFYSGADDDWLLAVVTGTPAASPAEPTVPVNAHVLARVDVAAAASSITDAAITDRREEAVAGDGGLRAVITFTSSGTFEKADYPWLRAVRVTCVGGGGGGGGAESTSGSEGSGGEGGSGGTLARSLIPVGDLSASETVSVGSGGAGVNGTTGGNGGDTTFGAHVTGAGGIGGAVSTTTATLGYAGAGQVSGGGSTGDEIIVGGTSMGPYVSPSQVRGGAGGNSGRGDPGQAAPQSTASNGTNASSAAPGSGGSGGANNNSKGTPRTGGDGADGIVVLELYG